MTYPAAYPEVISVGAAGWTGQWGAGGGAWWRLDDVPDPAAAGDFYVAPFSSRARTTPPQELDVLAPGIWVVAPWQTNSGKVDVQYVEGTSFAAPLVAGIAALMLEKAPSLDQAGVETILTGSALTLPPGCRTVADPVAGTMTACWEANAFGAGVVTADAALQATP
jgi:subtilisin family serine protease